MSPPDLDLDLLRAFVAVADTGSFTAAADVVRRSQSAVSQKVLRLEESLGCRVFARTSRSLALTPDGERLLVAARQMLEFNDRVVRELCTPPARGDLRLGVAEDFIPTQLPGLLARFGRLNPGVHVQLRTGLSCTLLDAFDAGDLDAVIAKRSGAGNRGRVIWREPLVWLAAADDQATFEAPVRLVMLAPPCSYRDVMIATLDAVRRPWVAACTASSLMGVQAAVAGGLGMTLLGRSFLQEGMRIVAPPPLWPALPMTEVTVLGEERLPDLVLPLVGFLRESLAGRDALAEPV